MITTEEIVGLLDVHHLVGLCDEDYHFLESALAERCATQLLDTQAWARRLPDRKNLRRYGLQRGTLYPQVPGSSPSGGTTNPRNE